MPTKNFAISAVATAPAPAASGTSLAVAAGEGSRFPAAPFQAVIWPAGAVPTVGFAEVVTVTAVAADTLTLVRAREGTAARSVLAPPSALAPGQSLLTRYDLTCTAGG